MLPSLALRHLKSIAQNFQSKFKRTAHSFTTKHLASTTTKLSSLPFFSLGATFSSASASGIKSGSMAEMGMLSWLACDVAINVIGWAWSAIHKTEKYYDMVGTGSFLTLTAGSLFLSPGPLSVKKLLVSSMVGIWAVRLGSYLVHRVHHIGKDKRFDSVKEKPGQFLVYWLMQSLWVFVTLSPVLIVNLSRASPTISLLDLPGLAIFALGLTTEVVADRQKAEFREQPENKGRYIKEGLWAASRHPNYVGEVCLWTGIFLTCASSFTTIAQWSTAASPLFVFGLIRFLSGVPILEAGSDEKWGKEEEYLKYKEQVPVFWPSLKSIQGALFGINKQD